MGIIRYVCSSGGGEGYDELAKNNKAEGIDLTKEIVVKNCKFKNNKQDKE